MTSAEPSPTPDPRATPRSSGRPSGWRRRIDSFLVYRARTWMIIPFHLLAFMVLYFATLHLLETSFTQATAEGSRLLLRDVVGEMVLVAPVRNMGGKRQHMMAHLLALHQDIDLRFYDLEGRISAELQPGHLPVASDVVDFARSHELDRFWMGPDPNSVEMIGMIRVVADRSCEPCHSNGQALAVASMSLDLSDRFATSHGELKRNLLILLVVWVVALGLSNLFVQKSVQRSTRRLQADLDAALGGGGSSSAATELVLDPRIAELHESLHTFLKRQRERDGQVTARLEQTDRLASLGQLAAGLAHEIKNPLAGIQGALEILHQDLPDESPDQTLVEQMLDEMGRVNGTLKLLLTSARPSPPRLAATDLGGLLEDIRGLLVPGLRKRSVVLELEVAPDLPPAWVDVDKIRQVLINLISIAGEAIEEGGRVVVKAGPFPDDEGLILAVEDDGPGIPEEDRKRIFEPFFTTKFSGTGLGLAISRRLVEQHGGRLQVESVVGEGTTFFIILPAANGQAGVNGLA